MSTTPAFSPGPCTTWVPRVGSFVRCAQRLRAVLAPHDAENSELCEIRITAEDFLGAPVFVFS